MSVGTASSLLVFAGPVARKILQERGLQAKDVRVIPGAAGGPKGLVLNPLDRFLFGHWLSATGEPVHLLGASIGAWRMAAACMPNADAALARLADDYVTQRYDHRPGRAPEPAVISRDFGAKLREHFGGVETQVLGHPVRRLHVFTSRGRHLLSRDGRWRTPVGYAGAFLTNALHRRALGLWLQRVVFGDPRTPLPFPLDDLSSCQVNLNGQNLCDALLASCSIPMWLDAVQNVPGGPNGAYWDGGITDYHLHLNYAAMQDGLVLYPHFQSTVVPGWLDKPWRRRHGATRWLDNLVLLAPNPAWIGRLPGNKLPDRTDFKTYVDDDAGRQRVWRRAIAESQALADDFASLVTQPSVQALPLV